MNTLTIVWLLAAVTTLASPLDPADNVVVRARPSRPLAQWCRINSCDIWAHSPSLIDLRLPRAVATQLVSKFPTANATIMEGNVDMLIRKERTQVSQLRHVFRQALEAEDPSTADDLYFDNYHTYEEMVGWSNRLAKRYPDLAKVEQFGTTLENRTLTMVRVTGTGGNSTTKKRVWISALQHAREWIAASSAQYVTEQLLKGYADKNARTVKLLDDVEFLIVPVSNPDGYVYTWTPGNRLHRKNMRRYENGTLYGVDLNRNWPSPSWCDPTDEGYSSHEPSYDTYCGEKPLSEPETASLAAKFQETPNIIGALDFHSYTQLLLRPYGYTQSPAPLFIELPMAKVSQSMYDGIVSVNATTKYTQIRAVDLYQAPGLDDYWNTEAIQPGQQRIYGMTIELSPPGDGPWQGGFILGPERIRGVGQEMTEAVLRFAEFVSSNPLPKKGGR